MRMRWSCSRLSTAQLWTATAACLQKWGMTLSRAGLSAQQTTLSIGIRRKKDAADYVKRSLNDFYHELCHRYIYRGPEHSAQKLPQMEKSLFFILQNLHYVETGVFCLRRRELLHALPERDQAVYLMLNGDSSFEEAFDALLKWCQDAMNRME